MENELAHPLRHILDELKGSVPGVRGGLLASIDGFAITDNFGDTIHEDSDNVAALIAAALGLGQQLIGLVGPSALRESMTRSKSGYVCVYAVDTSAVLTVLAEPSVNLARLNLNARDAVAGLALLLTPASAPVT